MPIKGATVDTEAVRQSTSAQAISIITQLAIKTKDLVYRPGISTDILSCFHQSGPSSSTSLS